MATFTCALSFPQNKKENRGIRVVIRNRKDARQVVFLDTQSSPAGKCHLRGRGIETRVAVPKRWVDT